MSSLKVCKTACGICAPCCPVDAYVKDGKLISVEGSKSRPGQSCVHCSKGMAAKQYVYNKGLEKRVPANLSGYHGMRLIS